MPPLPNKHAPTLAAADAADVAERHGAKSPAPSSERGRGVRLSAMASAMGSLRGERESVGRSGHGSASRERPPALRIAEQLRESCGEQVILLHHRQASRPKPQIDHLVVCPSGVWIIHSRRNQGRVTTRKPMFGDPKLTIGGRERTDLLRGLARQVDDVQTALATSHPQVEVRSALCFADTEAPLLRPMYLGSYLFFGSQALAKHLNSDGPLAPTTITQLAASLELSFPPA